MADCHVEVGDQFWMSMLNGPRELFRVPQLIRKTDSGCWEWAGYVGPHGYGVAWVSGRRRVAHRVVFEMMRYRPQAHLQLDHLCRNRRCVNPNHLEPVTAKENMLRSEALPAKFARATHCSNGHAFAGYNVTISTTNGQRVCRTCSRERQRRYRQRRRDAANPVAPTDWS